MFHSHPANVVDEQFGKCDGEKYEIRPGRNTYELVLVQSAWNLQKNDSYAFNSEHKFFFTSSQWPLAYVLLLLAIFWCHLVNFPSEKSILPYFSSPRGVAILDCDSHSQAGSTSLHGSSQPCYMNVYN